MKNIPSIFFNNKPSSKKQAWQYWPSCNHPKTRSFRASNDDVFKTVNSIFLDTTPPPDEINPGSQSRFFTNSTSTTAGDFSDNNSSSESLETIIRGVRLSERLFFEPGSGTTSSIVELEEVSRDREIEEEADRNDRSSSVGVLFKETSVEVVALESDDPYVDFKRSMGEMVESNGLMAKDGNWDCLEELLRWYLRMNAKSNHVFIIGAFVDLLVDMGNIVPRSHRSNRCKNECCSGSSSSSSMAVCCSDSTTSYSSAGSCFSSSPCDSSTLSPTVKRVVGVVLDGCDRVEIGEGKDVISLSY